MDTVTSDMLLPLLTCFTMNIPLPSKEEGEDALSVEKSQSCGQSGNSVGVNVNISLEKVCVLQHMR